MNAIDSFVYSEAGAPRGGADRRLVVVPAGIRDARQLLMVLAARLEFPEYFGVNWNALSDCLRDLHWVRERTVVLEHEDLPAIAPNDLVQYLEVLAESVSDWKAGEEHELIVAFRPSCRERIHGILGLN